ncbi:MAG: hypothetical protein IBX58_16355 [Roseovarius sp.]|nr:hypothetical protein [Roseovarius sp.]
MPWPSKKDQNERQRRIQLSGLHHGLQKYRYVKVMGLAYILALRSGKAKSVWGLLMASRDGCMKTLCQAQTQPTKNNLAIPDRPFALPHPIRPMDRNRHIERMGCIGIDLGSQFAAATLHTLAFSRRNPVIERAAEDKQG